MTQLVPVHAATAQHPLTYLQGLCLYFKQLYWQNNKRSQFAVLTVGYVGGHNNPYNPWPLQPGVHVNYVSSAYMTDPNDPSPSHTEHIVLSALGDLWSNHVNAYNSSPAYVFLFTYNSPCSKFGSHDCAGAIAETARAYARNGHVHTKWYVGYNQMFIPRSYNIAEAELMLNDARQKLMNAGVELVQMTQHPLAYLQGLCLYFKQLYWQNNKRPQFAVLTVDYVGGHNNPYNPWPLQPGVRVNYVSSVYLRDPDDPSQSHTEPAVLNGLVNLWNYYVNAYNGFPAYVFLFTYNSPCSKYGSHDCAGAIAETARAYANTKWYVGYNKMYKPPDYNTAAAELMFNDARQKLMKAGVELVKIPHCRGT